MFKNCNEKSQRTLEIRSGGQQVGCLKPMLLLVVVVVV